MNKVKYLKRRIKIFYFLFHLYVYPPDTTDNVGNDYIGQAIIPTCFRKFQNIVVRLKFFMWLFSFIEI